MLVLGTSLKVSPVRNIPAMIPPGVPSILVNREVVGKPNRFDVELLGNCDAIVAELAARLGWDDSVVGQAAPGSQPALGRIR